MRLALLLAVMSWAVPLAAQDVPVIERPQKGTTIVHYKGESVGLRDNADGTRDSLKAERDWRKGWLGKTLKAHRVGRLPDEAIPLTPDTLPSARVAGDVAGDADVTWDLLVVWTPRSEALQGGKAAMEAFAILNVAIANETYANSGSPNFHLRLVGAERVEYVEGTIQTSLSNLSGNGEGFMDGVHARRNALGADLVHLIGEKYTTTAGGGFCGMGYLNATMNSAFSVSDRLCSAGNLSFAHEIGHNQGLNHDPETVCGAATCPGGYGFGHSWPVGAPQERDTMAYPAAGGARIRAFSNPDIVRLGVPTGIPGQRDNARRLRDRALEVAGWRATVVIPPPMPKPSKPGKPHPRA